MHGCYFCYSIKLSTAIKRNEIITTTTSTHNNNINCNNTMNCITNNMYILLVVIRIHLCKVMQMTARMQQVKTVKVTSFPSHMGQPMEAWPG